MKVDPCLCKAYPTLFKILNSHPTVSHILPYHILPILIYLNTYFLPTQYIFNMIGFVLPANISLLWYHA